ncbi:DUF4253 domain-containing protein [Aneurinibacillus sp. REN35]|uniref:DUF4253 domain-containing protein n=1 Tax=Aneurinibacillus sp. REN35 TaxID=3237286 RepID=UPI00352806DA
MNIADMVQELQELTGQTVRPYFTVNFGRTKKDGAYSVLVEQEDAFAVIQTMRSKAAHNVLSFIGTTSFLSEDAPAAGMVEVVLGTGDSQFDILRLMETDAVNYDMLTEEVIEKLIEYDRAFGIDIFQAETDTVQFLLAGEPEDWDAFCEDLYEFCPDIVDQGCGSVEALKEELQITERAFLWWD